MLKNICRHTAIWLLVSGATIAWVLFASGCFQNTVRTIKVGVLHSHTGIMASSEQGIISVLQMAIGEANRLDENSNFHFELVIGDGSSKPEVFAQEARRLIIEEKVSVIFGCWTSDSRKAVRDVIEELNNLLIYSVQFEGFEKSSRLVYLGLTPNQQMYPVLRWTRVQDLRRYYLIGSDYVFPRTSNRIMESYLNDRQCEIVGENYQPIENRDYSAIVKEIAQARPDVILNTINGDGNLEFLTQLGAVKWQSEKKPIVVSFSVGERLAQEIGEIPSIRHLIPWSYFSNIKNAKNSKLESLWDQFLEAQRPQDKETSSSSSLPEDLDDPMQCTYNGFQHWLKTVIEHDTADPEIIADAILDRAHQGAEGWIYIDPVTRHSWRHLRIGEVTKDGVKIIWSSDHPIPARPFPIAMDPTSPN